MAIKAKISISQIAEFLGITNQAVHKRIKSKSIEYHKTQNKMYFTHNGARNILEPSCKQYIISTSVVKGGVGKTTIAESIAIRSSLYGLKVLVIDLDQQANLTKGLQMDEVARNTPVMIDIVAKRADPADSIVNVTEGIDMITSRLDNVTLDSYMMLHRVNPIGLFKRLYGNLLDPYDLIIFDCPPTLGTLVCSAMSFSNLVIAPLNPDIYSYEGLEIMQKEVNNIKEEFGIDINWRVLLNKFDSRTILSTDYISQLIKDKKYSEKLLKSVVRTSQDFPNTKNKGLSLYDNFRKSTAKEDIDCLVKELIDNYMHVNFA
ncbi:ParA family protein [Facilibium subflavum]|jgi:chromosome partitioning protein|uniref:ParA family protein n=1 Tax=Facilibium subflavum TaxID=2219058 RepID=UPI000E64AB71|nr:ParA family protein [Facilibium subflavum]